MQGLWPLPAGGSFSLRWLGRRATTPNPLSARGGGFLAGFGGSWRQMGFEGPRQQNSLAPCQARGDEGMGVMGGRRDGDGGMGLMATGGWA